MSARRPRRPARRPALHPIARRDAAVRALLVAAAVRSELYDRWLAATTDRAERELLRAWELAHADQTAAAVEVHAANRAVGRQPTDVVLP